MLKKCVPTAAGEALEMRVDSLVTFNSCISACELLGPSRLLMAAGDPDIPWDTMPGLS